MISIPFKKHMSFQYYFINVIKKFVIIMNWMLIQSVLNKPATGENVNYDLFYCRS